MDNQPDLIAKIDELIAATREASVPAHARGLKLRLPDLHAIGVGRREIVGHCR